MHQQPANKGHLAQPHHACDRDLRAKFFGSNIAGDDMHFALLVSPPDRLHLLFPPACITFICLAHVLYDNIREAACPGDSVLAGAYESAAQQLCCLQECLWHASSR
jgi:hypothetical protein